MLNFNAYANESDAISLANLTIENRLDRVSLYGDIDLTADRQGLALAKQLQGLLDQVVAALESRDLPEALPPPHADTVPNPFDQA
ncbi:hypothetical protein [Undibacterium sp.]|jgi:hypothetical protein|uniref:hypothetical protein n=1 Tax=Undibacterium sp. TaxID=1914977 RepID=UPI002B8D0DC3|nr:hypothetical protein [Undibacterium sp.]HTD06531.1 hypothetical protein [Undibacterium sp.]